LKDEPNLITMGCHNFELVAGEPGEVPDLETFQVNFPFALMADDEIYQPVCLAIFGEKFHTLGVKH
jgi:hypothetical protein